MSLIGLTLLLSLSACATSATSAQLPPSPTYDPNLPFPIPASCWQPNYTDAAQLAAPLRAITAHWFGGAPLALGRIAGPIWTGGENQVVFWSEQGQPEIELRLLEGRPTPGAALIQSAQPPRYRGTLTFPKRGCWEIVATVKEQTLRVQVYIYSTQFAK